MEHGAVCIIPARYASSRLPGKPLVSINGKPMIAHVCERAARARSVSRVIVATDDERIIDAARAHGFEAVMTSPNHQSGTDRVAEVAAALDCDLIVNVQGDEPLIDPAVIDAAVEPLRREPCLPMSTTREPIDNVADVLNPNVVKVVTDAEGLALYFTRSPVPFPRHASDPTAPFDLAAWKAALGKDSGLLRHYFKHTGLYAYRRKFLLKFAKLAPSELERQEALEQLRALQHGYKIKVVTVSHRSIGVDTERDLEQVRAIIESS